MEPSASLADRESILPVLNTGAFVTLALFVALIPFPYGAVTPAGTFTLLASSFGIGALAFLTRPSRRAIGLAVLPLTALGLIALVGVVQLLPMSIGTLRRIAPISATTYADANEILELFNRRAIVPKISIAPSDTQATILLTLAYGVLFASATILGSTRLRRRILVGALILSAVVHVLYSTTTTLAMERLHGTFINPNHFAGYLQIALAFAFGIAWREMLYTSDRATGIRDLGERWEKRAIQMIGPALLWGVIAAGLALTRSRGGILAAMLATIILIALALLYRGKTSMRRSAIPIVLVVIAGVLFVATTTGDAPLLRLLASDPREIGADTRTRIWSASLSAFRQAPVLGSGLGTFREAFRRVQPASVVGLVEQAHNDFLQMLVTGGWVGATLVTIAVGSMLIILLRAWLRQRRREESAVALAGIGAMIALILHGLVEFNMSIPAIPATLAVMLGVAWAAATHEQRRPSPRAADPAP